jgi:sensor c-di-GMP phosphodiesterase-like protein
MVIAASIRRDRVERSGAPTRIPHERTQGRGQAVMIDDFGTGSSSLAYLQAVDVDGVRIDTSCIGVVGSDAIASAIVSAVLHMALALESSVAAEGVETDMQVHVSALQRRAGDSRAAGFGGVPSSSPGALR